MITDNYLSEIVKAMAGSTISTPSWVGFGSTTMTISGDTTSLLGELSPRSSTTISNSSNELTILSIRSGAVANSTTGDTLNSMGLFDSSTAGTLFALNDLPSILHTTDFDIEVEWKLTVNRP